MTGHKFGHLSVLGLDENNNKLWRCLCECGKATSLTTASLRHGGRTSCGCGIGRKNTRDPFRLGTSMLLTPTMRSALPLEVSRAIKGDTDLAGGRCPICAETPARRLTLAFGIRTEAYPKYRYDRRNYLLICERCWDTYKQLHRAGNVSALPELVATATDWMLSAMANQEAVIEVSPVRLQLMPLARLYLEYSNDLPEYGPAEATLRVFAQKVIGDA